MRVELLDKKIIAQYLSPKNQHYVDNMVIFDELSSTNTYLLEQLKISPMSEVKICLAESQTHGRGRLGRQWVSPFAKNIYLSLLWQFYRSPDELHSLTSTIGVAVIKALQRYGINTGLELKSPNDVLWQKRKLAGILVELVRNRNGEGYYAVIGVGLNLSMSADEGKEITQPWRSVAEIIQAVPERNKMVGLLLDQLLTEIMNYEL